MQSTLTSTAPAFSFAELDSYDEKPRDFGRERRYLCPLCGDGKPRNDAHRCFCVNNESGLWKCQRCDARGKLRDFWTDTKQAHLNPSKARSFARQRRARLSLIEAPSAYDEAAEWREQLIGLQPLSETAGAKYLEGRGIPIGVASLAGVQFHPKYFGNAAVMFPVCDRAGQTVALSGRYIRDLTPKTRAAGPKSEGAFMAPVTGQSGCIFAPLESATPAIIVTEAPIDALSIAAAGYPAIACIGTSGPRWLHLACGLKRVLLAFDADDAGDAAAEKIATAMQPYGAICERLRPEHGKDWNEVLQILGRDALADWLAGRLLS
jgi:hypothetical protein